MNKTGKDLEARRLALSVLNIRYLIEDSSSAPDVTEIDLQESKEQLETLSTQLKEIISENGEIFSQQELLLIQLNFLGWTNEDKTRVSWVTEMIHVLKWMMQKDAQIIPIENAYRDPSFEAVYTGEEVEGQDEDVLDEEEIILRAEKEAIAELERMKLWLARISYWDEFSSNPDHFDPGEFGSYSALIKHMSEHGRTLDMQGNIGESDLQLNGITFELVDPDLIRVVQVRAICRMKTLEWILDDSNEPLVVWDQFTEKYGR